MISSHKLLLTLGAFVRWVKESRFEGRLRNAEKNYLLQNREMEQLKSDFQQAIWMYAAIWRGGIGTEEVEALSFVTANRLHDISQKMSVLQSSIADKWSECEHYRLTLEGQYCVGEVHDDILAQLQRRSMIEM